MEVTNQVRAAYDQIAEEYARVNATMSPELVALAKELIDLVGRPAHILDIGCGHGRDMAWFEAQGLRVTGMDVSAGMLAQARRLVSGDLLLMDMQCLAFPCAQFDGAWCCASLLHVPENRASGTLKEMYRVLKVGGALVLSIQKGSGESWEGGYGETVVRFFARYDEKEMTTLLSDAGFVVLHSNAICLGYRTWLTFACRVRQV